MITAYRFIILNLIELKNSFILNEFKIELTKGITMRNINMITTNATAKMFKAANAAGMVMAAKNMKKGKSDFLV